MSNQKRKKQVRYVTVSITTDTEFKMKWAYGVLINALLALQILFDEWDKRAKVKVDFEEVDLFEFSVKTKKLKKAK